MNIKRVVPGFCTGEVAERFWGRTDIAEIAQGLRSCRNWIVRPSGSIAVRPGTTQLGDWRTNMCTGTGGNDFLIFPFRGRSSNYFVMLRDGADTSGDPRVVVEQLTATGSVVSVGTFPMDVAVRLRDSSMVVQAEQVAQSLFIVGNNFRPQRVVEAFDGTMDLDTSPVDSSTRCQFYKEVSRDASYDPLDTGGGAWMPAGRVIRFPGGTGVASHWAASGDYIRILGQTLAISNLVENQDVDGDGVLWDEVVLSSPIDDSFQAFTGVMAARPWPRPATYTNGNGKSADDPYAFPAESADRLSPNCIGFTQSRLIFANFTNRELGGIFGKFAVTTRMNMSDANDPFVMSPPQSGGTDASAIEYDYLMERGEAITFVRSGRSIMVATTAGLWSLDYVDVLSASTIGMHKHSSIVASNVYPTSFGGLVTFVGRDGKTPFRADYSNDVQGFRVAPVSVLGGGEVGQLRSIVSAANGMGDRDELLIGVGDDGEVSAFVQSPYFKLSAAYRMDFGALVAEDVVVLGDGTVFFFVSRGTGASKKIAMLRLDSALTDGYSIDLRVAASHVSGDTWQVSNEALKSTTIVVLAKGTDYPADYVQAGSYTTDADGKFTMLLTATSVLVGLGVIAEASPLLVPPDGPEGATINGKYRVLSVDALVSNTRQGEINGKPIFSGAVRGTGDLPKKSAVVRKNFVGFNYVPELTFSGVAPYTMEVSSMTVNYVV